MSLSLRYNILCRLLTVECGRGYSVGVVLLRSVADDFNLLYLLSYNIKRHF